MNKASRVLLFLFIGTIFFTCKSPEKDLKGLTFKAQLQVLFPNAEISNIEFSDHFTEAYQLVLKQNLDHNNPNAGTFDHHIYVSHSSYNNPTVLVTEGYNARYQTYELSKILKSNQVMVEYRFYGNSRPNPIPWDYLKNDQAAADYHKIVSKLKLLYENKWISTGISKGGETTLIYKSKYPDDIDVAVPYVAPLINTQEDPRTNNLINTVGDDTCRSNIIKFQRAVLKNRDSIFKELEDFVSRKDMKFTKVPIEEAFEYSILEYPFSFWQWGAKCDDIPNEDASAKELWSYLSRISGVGLYNDSGFNHYLPSFYQHMIELGYYGFDLEPVKDLLIHVKNSSNARFAPLGVDLTYDESYIKEVRDYVETKGDKILYIYGEYDPWGACAPSPNETVDFLIMTLKGGHHRTRIKDFSQDDKQKIYSKLESWLGPNIKVNPI